MSKHTPPGRPLPPRFHNKFTFDWHRRFTLRERLQIAIGYQFKVTTEIYTVNSPGILQPVFIGQTTKHINPEDQAVADALAGPPNAPHRT